MLKYFMVNLITLKHILTCLRKEVNGIMKVLKTAKSGERVGKIWRFSFKMDFTLHQTLMIKSDQSIESVRRRK